MILGLDRVLETTLNPGFWGLGLGSYPFLQGSDIGQSRLQQETTCLGSEEATRSEGCCLRIPQLFRRWLSL